MEFPSFLLPPNGQVSPETLLRRRKMAEGMLGAGIDTSPIASPWQGAARMAQALVGGLSMHNADKAEQQGRAGAQDAILRAMAGGGDMNDSQIAELLGNEWMSPGQQSLVMDKYKSAHAGPESDFGKFAADYNKMQDAAGLPKWPPEVLYQKWSERNAGAQQGNEWGLNPVWVKDPKTDKMHLYQPNKGEGPPREMQFPYGMEPVSPSRPVDTGTEFQQYDSRGGFNSNAPTVPKNIAGAEAQKQIGGISGKAAGDLPRAEGTLGLAIKSINDLRVHPGRLAATGASSYFGGTSAILSPEGYDFTQKLGQVRGRAFLEAYNVLKGGGQITEVEGAKATDALAALDQAQTEGAFMSALDDLEEAFKTGFDKLKEQAAMTGGSQPATGAQEYNWTPEKGLH